MCLPTPLEEGGGRSHCIISLFILGAKCLLHVQKVAKGWCARKVPFKFSPFCPNSARTGRTLGLLKMVSTRLWRLIWTPLYAALEVCGRTWVVCAFSWSTLGPGSTGIPNRNTIRFWKYQMNVSKVHFKTLDNKTAENISQSQFRQKKMLLFIRFNSFLEALCNLAGGHLQKYVPKTVVDSRLSELQNNGPPDTGRTT